MGKENDKKGNMKRVFYGFILIFLLSCCFSLVGCDSRYGNLVMTSQLNFSQENTISLDNGAQRVTTSTGTFDINVDGSYTFYIEDSSSTSASLDVLFENVPNDFRYGARFNISNAVVNVNDNLEYIDGGIRTRITATSVGQADVNVISLEGGKTSTIKVFVKQVAESISFKNSNLAITNEKNSTVSFAEQVICDPLFSSIGDNSITYEFGQIVSGEFVKYSDSELVGFGLSFNAVSKNLTVIANRTTLESLVVTAVYDNPLKEDLIATTVLQVLPEIDEFEIFSGLQKTDAVEENKILDSETQEFAVNFNNLNYADIILKVKSKGVLVSFSFLKDALSPFDITAQPVENDVEYLNEDLTYSYVSYEDATYTLIYLRLTASKTITTVNASYPNGTFTLQFTCDYADYEVDGFPLSHNYVSKCFNLIKNFSINNIEMESISAGDETAYDDYAYEEKLYMDTDNSLLGTSFEIGVSNPTTVLNEDAKFILEFYNSALEALVSPLDILSISYKTNLQTRQLTKEILSEGIEFDINTKLYIKLNSTGGVTFTAGQVYYVVLRAVYPNTTEQAVATIELTVAQGIREISSLDYSYLYYEVDGSGEYVLDEYNEKNVLEQIGNITFTNYNANSDLNLDLENNFNSYISFNCLPEDSSLENLIITSQNTKILTIEKKADNRYLITTKSIGSTYIEITASNLTQKYVLKVNIYKPITNMVIGLTDTSIEMGVGKFEQDANGNLLSATVKNNRNISFNLTILPSKVSQYSISYVVTRNDANLSVQIGTYSKDANGNVTGTSINEKFIIEDLGRFRIDLVNRTFIFSNTQNMDYTYTITVTLTNINGVMKQSEFVLSSYVCVETMSISLPVTTVYDPSTLSYQSKIQTIDDMELNSNSIPTNDDSIFGVSVNAFSKDGGTPSYSFLENGRIIFLINGVKDSEYYASSGILSSSYSVQTSFATLLSSTAWNGYFWFKLNENYDFSTVKTIVVNALIKELDYFLSRDKNISVSKALTSSSILVNYDSVSENNYELNFKKGLTSEKEITLQLQKNTSYNKNLLYLILNEKEVNGTKYLVLPEEGYGLINVQINSTGIEAQYKMSINVNSSDLSTAYIIVIPQDKILSSTENETCNEFSYLSISLSSDTFEEGMYYVLEEGEYISAEEYDENADYFVKIKSNISSVLSIWQGTLVFKITVSNGEDTAYYISTLEELKQICANEESSTKNYILTKDISASSSGNFETLGSNFYEADVSGELADDDYYLLNFGVYTLADLSGDFDKTLTYYRTGFHGTLSGEHVVTGIQNEMLNKSYYGITNITYTASTTADSFSVIAKLGKSGKIENLSVKYSSYQPSFAQSIESFTFGGIVAVNYGTIENVKVSFSNVYFGANKALTFGGIVGKNFGTITQSENNLSGVKGSINITLSSNDYDYNIGGMVGENYSILSGKYSLNQTLNYTFNDAGFDSSLIMNIISGNVLTRTNIGGVAGLNSGKISNISVQGKIIATNCDNVGGLVGKLTYDENYNGVKDVEENGTTVQKTFYSLSNSYSIIIITANDYVGGAVGRIEGQSAESMVYLYNISAENYSANNTTRTLVTANNVVGGLIGYAKFLNLNYSYFISYFNCSAVTTNVTQNYNYDIVGNQQVAGLIGEFENTDIHECATNLNIKAQSNASLFVVQTVIDCTVTNAFAIGSLYVISSGDFTLGFGGLVNGFSYSCVYNVINLTTKYTCLNVESGILSPAEIISTFNAENYDDMWNIDNTNNINSGLPYLQILEEGTGVQQAMFASSSINIVAIVKDNISITLDGYIKNDENSLVIFLNSDEYGKYKSADIASLNKININDLMDIIVYPQTSKTSRIQVYSNNGKVVTFDDNGLMTIVGEGSAKIILSSKLNSNFYKEIYVYVILGFSDIEIYANVGLTSSLDGAEIELLTLSSQNLYVETFYDVTLGENEIYNLTSTQDIGVRFVVTEADLELLIGETTDQTNSINSIFQIGNNSWRYDQEEHIYYVDINPNGLFLIMPLEAMQENKSLNISFYPYITPTFDSAISTIFFNEYSGNFTLSIVKGATSLVFENNISKIEMNQLQVAVIDVTIFTDYSDDVIIDNFDQIEQENGNFGSTIGGYTYTYDQDTGIVESISMTYTIWYKDKTNAIDGNINFNLVFFASSNSSLTKTLNLTITSFSALDSVGLSIYDELDNFPQESNKNNVIYNGETGLLSVEVYPYFAKFNTLQISYATTSSSSLSIMQISYDASASSGVKWSSYEDSGAVIQNDGSLIVQKISGQDTYKINTDNKYSYSKSYFFSLIVGSGTTNGSQFVVTVKVLNSNKEVISTNEISIITLAQPVISLSFDESLKGTDGKYYLPYNTLNELDVNLVNFSGKVNWQIESVTNYVFTPDVEEILMPVLQNGKYYLTTLRYNSDSEDVHDPYIIGNEFILTAQVDDGQNIYNYTLNFVITLFTVTNIEVQDVTDGTLTLQTSTTTPLQVNVEASYDSAITSSSNNWYTSWYENNGDNSSDKLYQNIVASGYDVEELFQNYITKLKEKIAQAKYNPSSSLISGVFSYVSESDIQTNLTANTTYNDDIFRVENYKEFFALVGLRINKSSSLRYNVKLSYYGPASVGTGMPNVENYNSEISSNYKHTFSFIDDFNLIFVFKTELINYIPISNSEDFMNMQEGYDYRLVSDIELSNYTPFSANFSSFDGNNHTIYISSFSYSSNTTQACNLGLFSEVSKDTIIINTTVLYTNKVQVVEGELIPSSVPLQINFYQTQTVVFGGITCVNNGVLSNCKVTGGISIDLDIDSTSDDSTSVETEKNGGLVATNSSTGYITNSKVENFSLICYGQTGGFVCNNSGKIVASSFDESSVGNLSSDNMGGFAYSNSSLGSIYECYSQGVRSDSDRDIRNTGNGLASYGGDIGGFIYTNSGTISDCYSNIKTSSSSSMAGFFYVDLASSVISRCYSISYKNPNDNNTTAFPFAGPLSSSFEPRIEVKGTLNNCFYLTSSETWRETGFYIEDSNKLSDTPDNKKAVGLSFDNFATHTSFTNYDLSLVYSTSNYVDSTASNLHTYNFVDGYTWVIIEGKPVIVSTLINTVSMCDYIGKTKNYSSIYNYFDVTNQTINAGTTENISSNKTKTTYYGVDVLNLTTYEIYSITIDNALKTLTYEFAERGDLEKMTIYYDITQGIENATLISAETGDEEIQVLDVETESEESITSDDNFRANDTIVIDYNENGEIIEITYKVLENASYSYTGNVSGVSDVQGTRTNPYLIYDYNTFNSLLNKNTSQKFYRILKDIDLNSSFVSTVHSSFQGVLQGNYMTVLNISLSYLNSNIVEGFDVDSFGLFASITTVADDKLNSNETFDTVISNFNLQVDQVLSNAHKFVGALAGRIGPSTYTVTDETTGEQTVVESQNSNQKIFLNNIKISGIGNNSSYIYGKNAVGGLAGIATGRVIIKDITCDVSVNATFEISNTLTDEILYTTDEEVDYVSYSGGVVGIFDVAAVVDDSTQKNYNATNIIVLGRNSYIGSIVGSAFGLVGQNAIVNYVNTTVTYAQSSYIKAVSYAGGLVGENRGTIISSSINYEEEDNTTVYVGYSFNTEYNFFYNSSRYVTIAVGGLVGINNGGTISNSICSINVRNKRATIAGGAVGRMLEGTLDYVVTGGSVVAKSIMGGLIGTINDVYTIVNEGGYNANAIIKVQYLATETTKQTYADFIANSTVEENEKVTVIKNCVSATNWLFMDYDYYDSILKKVGSVGGFIGLVSCAFVGTDVVARMNEFVEFSSQSFYSNTLYKTNTTSVNKYIKPIYTSKTIDSYNSVITVDPITLTDENGNQSVYPYATSSFYNEVNLSSTYYRIKMETNTLAGTSTEGDVYMEYVYSVTSSSPTSITNDGQFFKEIDGTWTATTLDRTYSWYKNHFGKFYQKITDAEGSDTYVSIGTEDSYNSIIQGNANEMFYYVSTPVIDNFQYSTNYLTENNNIVFFGIDPTSQKGADGYSFNTLLDFKTQTSISVNGITIPLDTAILGDVDESLELEDTFTSIEYKYSNVNLTLPDGRIITSLSFIIKSYMTGSTKWFYAENVTLNYLCENVAPASSTAFDVFVNLSSTTINVTTTYSLNVSSKKVIYHAFENGYWSFDNNFFSLTYSVNSKFPTNEELADIYVWSSFITPFVGGNQTITDIDSAEDLAALAYSVNVLGQNYDGVEVRLLKDIDLSGKYWVPIGTDETPFKGTFKGINTTSLFSIKYASVNENSLYSSTNTLSNTLPTYAGLFGKVENASLQNFIVIGGEFYGVNTGGVAGIATNSIISNVENRNTIVATENAGGIVGVNYSLEGVEESSFINCKNYGEVKVVNTRTSSDPELYMGGIVGKLNVLTVQDILDGKILKLSTFTNNKNYGKLLLNNKLNNYTALSSNKVSVFVGGLVGMSSFTSFGGENANYGNIILTTNAHKVYVGGVTGYIVEDTSSVTSISNFKNDSTFTISYENSCKDETISSAYCYVGGVVGYSSKELTLASGAGQIDFNCRRATLAEIAVAGVVAKTSSSVSESYSMDNINLSSSDSSTYMTIAGVVGLINLDTSLSILNCYNSGDITADSTSNIFVGGIAGKAISAVEINYLNISNCLNIGKISVQSINESKNALGAIVAVDDYIYTGYLDETDDTQSIYMRNYYLRGSASSGNTNYFGMTSYDISTDSYKATDDIITFCDSQISTDLKDKTISFIDWDFSNIWGQEFDTWYPTLKQNDIKTLWVDKSSEVTSVNKIFIIESAEQLAYIADQINNGYITTKNVTFKLKKQIDLANKYWTPIGTKDYPFSGTFDGDGYVIKNLTIDGNVLSNKLYGGLFGFVQDAVVTNFGLESVIIKNVDYAGGVAYSVENSAVSKVFTEKGDSVQSKVEGLKGAGGLIYQMINDESNSNSTCSLKYSYNNVDVSGSLSGAETQIVGGIVAKIQNAILDNSYNGENAVISRKEAVSGVDDGILVVGKVEENCSLLNVFNLSPTVADSSTTYSTCSPKLFYLDEPTSSVVATTLNPIFENLTVDGYELSDIWTKEYSLHEDAFSIYPSLRGLGQNWKNTESDSLLSYNYNLNNATAILATKHKILEDIEDLGVSQTLVSFGSDNTTTSIKTIYLISTAEELSWLATNVNSGMFSSLNCEFLLVNDIDLSGKYWTPIGNSSINSFRGIFNFNGHVISGLRIDTSNLSYGGLFGYTSNAQILNGYIDKAFIKVKSESTTSKIYVGTVVGFAENTIIKNISVSTNIVGLSKAGTYVGGIVGLYTGSIGYEIKNVHVYRTGSTVDLGSYENMVAEEVNGSLGVIKKDTVDILAVCSSGLVYVGGVAGYLSGYSTTGDDFVVEYADNETNLAGVSTSNSSNVYAGGIVGYGVSFSINASHNKGNVKTYSSKYDVVGGIVGYSFESRLSNCYFSDGYIESRQATGRDTTNENIWSYVGGIVGWTYSGSLEYCVSVGNTRANSQNQDLNMGAIIGKAEQKIFNLGEVDSENVYSTEGTGFSISVGHYDSSCEIIDELEEIFLTEMSTISDSGIFKSEFWSNSNQTLKDKRIFLMSCGEITLKANSPIDNPLINSTNPGLYISSLNENTVTYEQDAFEEGDKIGIAVVKIVDNVLTYEYFEMELGTTPDNGYDLSTFITVADGVDIVTCYVTVIRD